MKEFVEKLIEKLEEYQGKIKLNFGNRGDFDFMEVDAVKEIANQLAEEYKTECNSIRLDNGWIPCIRELPKFPNTYLVTKMCECDGKPIYETAHEIFWGSDGKWDCERDEDSEWKVIAWQNKIAPYQPKGE